MLRQVGRADGRKPFAHQSVDRVALQGQLQQDRLVLEEVKAMARHVGARLKIHQIELLGQLHVVERREIERRQRRFSAEHFQVRLVVHPDRRIRVRKVGNPPLQGVQVAGQLFQLGLQRLVPLAKLTPLFLACLAFGRIFGLADRLGNFVRLAIEFLDLDLQPLATFFELHKAVDIDLNTAIGTVLFHQLAVFDNELSVEHGNEAGLRFRDWRLERRWQAGRAVRRPLKWLRDHSMASHFPGATC